jgi:murein L,D-transpeptidase YcbB/YkuD
MKAPIVILVTLLWLACNPQKQQTALKSPNAKWLSFTDTLPAKEIAGNFNTQSSFVFDSTAIQLFLQTYPAFSPFKLDLQKFYRKRNFAYAWHLPSGLIEQSYILYNNILQSEDNGIFQDIPYADVYKKMMEENNSENILFRELMLTNQYLNYAKQVLTGITESESQQLEWFIPRKKLNYSELLDTLLKNKFTPPDKLYYPQYEMLKEKLHFFYTLEKNNNWPIIIPDKKRYKLGDTSTMIINIRKKLQLLGDLTTNNNSDIFDNDLLNAVKQFEYRYGLTQDGIIGKTVIEKLNQPISNSIKQIIINMERCRWLPNETDKDYLVVNIPEFKLYAHEKDAIAFSCNVVVGKLTNKTVIFRGIMQNIVFAPYWNIPQEILTKEILPEISKNPNYLSNHEMEWSNGKLRQKPGQQNALGKIKFIFPNSYNIYLHDTPSKSLFSADSRAFSHGCIRVSEPLKLALFLLRNDSNWNEQKILSAMNSNQEKFITLRDRVPVYVIYLTSFVDEKGKINFREDMYNRDEKLKEMIFSKNQEKMIK